MAKNYDMIGETFNKLTVLEYMYTKNHKKYYKCKCVCGNETIVQGICLRNGHTKSCGCLHAEASKDNVYKSLIKYKNKYVINNNKCHFTLMDKEGKIHNVLIDIDDLEKVKKHQWKLTQQGYVRNNKVGFLHRYILNVTDEDVTVDHIYHNKLDNRKSQLRLCSQKENNYNKKRKGYIKENNKFVVRMDVEGKTKRFGKYENENDAIKKRELLEKEYFGEYAYKGNQ